MIQVNIHKPLLSHTTKTKTMKSKKEHMVQRLRVKPWDQVPGFILVLLLISSVTLDKLLNLSKPFLCEIWLIRYNSTR